MKCPDCNVDMRLVHIFYEADDDCGEWSPKLYQCDTCKRIEVEY